jgi:hypothetical protein
VGRNSTPVVRKDALVWVVVEGTAVVARKGSKRVKEEPQVGDVFVLGVIVHITRVALCILEASTLGNKAGVFLAKFDKASSARFILFDRIYGLRNLQ